MSTSVDPSSKPTIGITMGDPAGIGPEIVLKALADRELRRQARFIIYGLNELMNYEADRQEINPFWSRVQHDSERTTRQIFEDCVLLDFDEFDGLVRSPRQPSKMGGIASKLFVEEAINDAMLPIDGAGAGHPRRIDAIVTGPICKESWMLGGFNWPGHTELLAYRTKAKRHSMMFVSPRLRVALCSTHIPLNEIRNVLTIGRIFDPIDLGNEACKQLGIERPRIAVTGLNPHAGENGQFGDEEARLIEPAVRVAQEAGIHVRGPFPADTIFIRAAAGDYDLVVAMYHDQGLIPVKLLGWDKAVNWTIGLPIIRTSPDHGTAFDIAGKNPPMASANSMRAAIDLAIQLARNKMAAPVVNRQSESAA
jgi:4-hydroxythreonine-4-phosphate dehydrogenase